MLDFKKKLLDIVGENASIKHIQETLKSAPYFITFKYNETLGLLKYNRDKSDLSNQFVRECRGLVFQLHDYVVVNHALDCGLNETEFKQKYCINDCIVYESIDGTLLNIYHDDNEWKVSTKGCIDANKSKWYSEKSFFELMNDCVNSIDYSLLDKDCCYSIVLSHEENQIVIKPIENRLYHVYTRNIKTNEYVDKDIGISKPDRVDLNTYNTSDLDKEGIMLFSKDMIDRCKIQTDIYKKVKDLRGNQNTTWGRILSLPKKQINDYLDYFPEDKDDYISLCRTKTRLFSSILNIYIQTKIKRIYTEIPKHLKYPVYELHNIYKQSLTEYNEGKSNNKPYISKKQIMELFHSIPIYKQLYLLQSESVP